MMAAWREMHMPGTALITGGAGGIGLALAKQLMGKGYALVLSGSNEAALREAAAGLGGGTRTVVANLTDPADVERLAGFIQAEAGLELLVNNAGVIEPGAVTELPWPVLERHIAVNLTAPMRLTQAAAQVMASRGAGCILSVLSAAALIALPNSAAYSASKFGLRGFLIAASQELAPRGVRIRCVLPGAVDTKMLRDETARGGSSLNFLNKDVLTADQVAAACLRAIAGRKLETHLPTGDGISARLLSGFPDMMPRLMPLFRKQAERGRARFLASRGLK
jgi:short-subunit dehydrogenase